jgi:hypothetical protein
MQDIAVPRTQMVAAQGKALLSTKYFDMDDLQTTVVSVLVSLAFLAFFICTILLL